jgi:hypothetical protein
MRPVVLREHWPFVTLQQADRDIIIKRDHKALPHGTCLLEVLNMSHMQEVKTSVREYNTFTTLATILQGDSQLIMLQHFARTEHIPGARYIELPGDDHLTLREGDHGVFDDTYEG